MPMMPSSLYLIQRQMENDRSKRLSDSSQQAAQGFTGAADKLYAMQQAMAKDDEAKKALAAKTQAEKDKEQAAKDKETRLKTAGDRKAADAEAKTQVQAGEKASLQYGRDRTDATEKMKGAVSGLPAYLDKAKAEEPAQWAAAGKGMSPAGQDILAQIKQSNPDFFASDPNAILAPTTDRATGEQTASPMVGNGPKPLTGPEDLTKALADERMANDKAAADKKLTDEKLSLMESQKNKNDRTKTGGDGEVNNNAPTKKTVNDAQAIVLKTGETRQKARSLLDIIAPGGKVDPRIASMTGPIAGRFGQFAETYAHSDPQRAGYYAQVAQYFEEIRHAITGAAGSDSEMHRLKRAYGSADLTVTQLIATLQAAEKRAKEWGDLNQRVLDENDIHAVDPGWHKGGSTAPAQTAPATAPKSKASDW